MVAIAKEAWCTFATYIQYNQSGVNKIKKMWHLYWLVCDVMEPCIRCFSRLRQCRPRPLTAVLYLIGPSLRGGRGDSTLSRSSLLPVHWQMHLFLPMQQMETSPLVCFQTQLEGIFKMKSLCCRHVLGKKPNKFLFICVIARHQSHKRTPWRLDCTHHITTKVSRLSLGARSWSWMQCCLRCIPLPSAEICWHWVLLHRNIHLDHKLHLFVVSFVCSHHSTVSDWMANLHSRSKLPLYLRSAECAR